MVLKNAKDAPYFFNKAMIWMKNHTHRKKYSHNQLESQNCPSYRKSQLLPENSAREREGTHFLRKKKQQKNNDLDEKSYQLRINMRMGTFS